MAYQLDSEDDYSETSEEGEDDDKIQEEKVVPAAELVTFSLPLRKPEPIPELRPPDEVIEDVVEQVIVDEPHGIAKLAI